MVNKYKTLQEVFEKYLDASLQFNKQYIHIYEAGEFYTQASPNITRRPVVF